MEYTKNFTPNPPKSNEPNPWDSLTVVEPETPETAEFIERENEYIKKDLEQGAISQQDARAELEAVQKDALKKRTRKVQLTPEAAQYLKDEYMNIDDMLSHGRFDEAKAEAYRKEVRERAIRESEQQNQPNTDHLEDSSPKEVQPDVNQEMNNVPKHASSDWDNKSLDEETTGDHMGQPKHVAISGKHFAQNVKKSLTEPKQTNTVELTEPAPTKPDPGLVDTLMEEVRANAEKKTIEQNRQKQLDADTDTIFKELQVKVYGNHNDATAQNDSTTQGASAVTAQNANQPTSIPVSVVDTTNPVDKPSRAGVVDTVDSKSPVDVAPAEPDKEIASRPEIKSLRHKISDLMKAMFEIAKTNKTKYHELVKEFSDACDQIRQRVLAELRSANDTRTSSLSDVRAALDAEITGDEALNSNQNNDQSQNQAQSESHGQSKNQKQTGENQESDSQKRTETLERLDIYTEIPGIDGEGADILMDNDDLTPEKEEKFKAWYENLDTRISASINQYLMKYGDRDDPNKGRARALRQFINGNYSDAFAYPPSY